MADPLIANRRAALGAIGILPSPKDARKGASVAQPMRARRPKARAIAPPEAATAPGIELGVGRIIFFRLRPFFLQIALSVPGKAHSGFQFKYVHFER
jgi:hypothetical protein